LKVGIIGGLGPESTVEYYKRIVDGYRKIKNDGSYPKIIIESIDMTEMLGYVNNRDYDGLVCLLAGTLNNLKTAGADFAVISSNTPHIVFDKLEKISPIQLISIVEEAGRKAQKLKLKKVGLLGTSSTMKENFYGDVFKKWNIDVVVPDINDQEYIQQIIFSELEFGIVKAETKKGLIEIIKRMVTEDGIDGVILGCTELPLILQNKDMDIPFIDTVDEHVKSIIIKL